MSKTEHLQKRVDASKIFFRSGTGHLNLAGAFANSNPFGNGFGFIKQAVVWSECFGFWENVCDHNKRRWKLPAHRTGQSKPENCILLYRLAGRYPLRESCQR